MTSEQVISGKRIKLHNRRVFVAEESDGGIFISFKRLDNNKKPKVTAIRLTREAASALMALLIDALGLEAERTEHDA